MAVKKAKKCPNCGLNSLKNMEERIAYRGANVTFVTRHLVQIEDLKSY